MGSVIGGVLGSATGGVLDSVLEEDDEGEPPLPKPLFPPALPLAVGVAEEPDRVGAAAVLFAFVGFAACVVAAAVVEDLVLGCWACFCGVKGSRELPFKGVCEGPVVTFSTGTVAALPEAGATGSGATDGTPGCLASRTGTAISPARSSSATGHNRR